MKILAISCSTNYGSIAVGENNQLLENIEWERAQSHGELVTPYLQEIMQKVNWDFSDLDLIAVDKGPGSFTGVRVAINSVKALAYSFETPIWAENSLRIMAEACPASEKKLFCCLNAFKNEVFVSSFEYKDSAWMEVLEAQSIEVEKLPDLIQSESIDFFGDAIEPYLDRMESDFKEAINFIKQEPSKPRARDLLSICFKEYNSEQTLDWKSLNSLYIKLSAAEEKLKKGLLKPLPKI
ncbi:MAG: tRNA (adenosine(37)-N6)-threonylcarbamoyltransferase complex dimerization subunit type 1 TsaB [Bdellovibrionota bacterium]|nr:tRNA (adenosine(37)-N6)-threonylcarbamoyltransferase complex dimerization subunit type 1 TsaB [Bdellovibrionota bacterium]